MSSETSESTPAPPRSQGSGCLSLPSKNKELRRLEEQAMFGKDITLRIILPTGRTEEMQVKESNEVGYIKLLLAQKCGISASQLQLFFDGKQLIDPMSLCDHQGLEPPLVNLEAKYAM